MMQTEVLRDFDRLVQRAFNTQLSSEPVHRMPMEAWRDETGFHAEFDLPGIEADKIDMAVEKNILTIRAERAKPEGRQHVTGSERLWGHFTRELVLGEHLDTESIQASYADGVLRLDIAVAESAKPRRIQVAVNRGGKDPKELTS
ncbi:Hsp20/alpha crystallin family protein [Glutamicibacter protophormiae]|uniref:HSP20 family protein n=1 Tax=Glutamicibacter protophormiae TaxID=37930 RepID=A0ABS4XMR6_GLUPR|nr:Hsp20/alpha crystallin family protein [Glutamicibacter protophormiae]MBP2397670.1 HSP20 family protein [Glutamicibacter protophormiae]QRQ78368.1 Hsp20/alpha crystallin family protein [Glutamicibacter protophormiae]GGL87455.1 18 kDa antigen (HSP 16.7) [Glutamicibacter protophormiae]